MAREQRGERDAALRALLVEQVRIPAAGSPDRRDRTRVGVISGVVLVLVVALSIVAIHLAGGTRTLPADGGLPTPTEPPGVVLGRFSSADGPNQTHVVHPDGMALAESFECRGDGAYSVSLSHDSDFSSPDSCTGGNGGSGNKGHQDDVTVRIRTTPNMRWTLVVSGIPETYVTPQPVPSPTTSGGAAAAFCTAADLDAEYQPRKAPDGVTEAGEGEIALTNRTERICALVGWPMVRFVDDDDTVLGHHTMAAIDERSSTEHGLEPVILQPGDTTWTQVGYYLPNYYSENESGPCEARTVHALRIDLANSFAGPAQTGKLVMPTKSITACLNGPWGTDGKYGQISATVFVDYSLKSVRR